MKRTVIVSALVLTGLVSLAGAVNNIVKKDNGQVVVYTPKGDYKVSAAELRIERSDTFVTVWVRSEKILGGISAFQANGVQLTAANFDDMTDGFNVIDGGGGGGGSTTWSQVPGKPFNSIGTGLTVTGGALNADGAAPAWTTVTGKPFESVGNHLTVVGGELATDDVAVLGNNNDFSGLNVFRGYTGFAGNATFTGNIEMFGDETRKINIYGIDSISASNTYTVDGAKEFTTKEYVDAAISGGGTVPTWGQVTGKPFSTVGSGLRVSHDSLIAEGGAPAWGDVTGKPFSVLGSGLHVSNDTLIADGGGGGAPAWGDVTGKPFTAIGAGLNVGTDNKLNASAQAWGTITGKPFTSVGANLAVSNNALTTSGVPTLAGANMFTGAQTFGSDITVQGKTTLGNATVDLITANAPILMYPAYTPTDPQHVATKNYVDALANGPAKKVGRTWNWTLNRDSLAGWKDVDYGDGTFIASGQRNMFGAKYISRDYGRTWKRDTWDIRSWWGIAYLPGVWAAVDFMGYWNYSLDAGVNWTEGRMSDYNFIDLGRTTDGWFIAIAQDGWVGPGTGNYYYMADLGNYEWHGVAGNDSVWIVVGDGGYMARSKYTSVYPNWRVQNAGAAHNWQNVDYGDGVWIAVDDSGCIARSIDEGVTWTVQQKFTGSEFYGVGYGENGEWVVCGWNYFGDGNLAYSEDGGVTWTLQNITGVGGYKIGWNNAVYGNGVWVLVGGQYVAYTGDPFPTQGIATKAYADAVLGNRTVDWTEVQNKPFDEVGDGLIAESDTVTGRAANAAKVLKLQDDDWGEDAHQDRDNVFSGQNSFTGTIDVPATVLAPTEWFNYERKNWGRFTEGTTIHDNDTEWWVRWDTIALYVSGDHGAHWKTVTVKGDQCKAYGIHAVTGGRVSGKMVWMVGTTHSGCFYAVGNDPASLNWTCGYLSGVDETATAGIYTNGALYVFYQSLYMKMTDLDMGPVPCRTGVPESSPVTDVISAHGKFYLISSDGKVWQAADKATPVRDCAAGLKQLASFGAMNYNGNLTLYAGDMSTQQWRYTLNGSGAWDSIQVTYPQATAQASYFAPAVGNRRTGGSGPVMGGSHIWGSATRACISEEGVTWKELHTFAMSDDERFAVRPVNFEGMQRSCGTILRSCAPVCLRPLRRR
jgi:hypothetical protein